MSLFPDLDEDDRPGQAARLAPRLRALADRGVYFGTSSWKYEGWLGSIYSPGRYATRGKVSKTKFDDECLTEYAEVFPTVCGDYTFYQFPSPDHWKRLFDRTPPGFLFGLKVPEDVTAAKWPIHPRYALRANQPNPHFLDPELFTNQFARPLEPYLDRVATLIFEFGAFPKSTFKTPDAFIASLDRFLEALPGGFRYAVEVRNHDYLGPGYFHVLSSHGVAHVLSAWTRMPELGYQANLEGVDTADFAVVRALLAIGRSYEKAVQTFEPYRLVQEPNDGAREAMAGIAGRNMLRKKPAFIYIDNRLEGHAPSTIEAVVGRLGF